MEVTDYLLTVLEQENIPYIFMVPGGYVDPFISALENKKNITGIVACHEGGAVFMADGYARASQKFGAALCIGGPGITNMTTGIATAYADEIPLFIITGETKNPWEGRGAFQDSSIGGINDTVILETITTRKLTLVDTKATAFVVEQLLHYMLHHARRGPVHLSVPADIEVENVDLKYQKLQNSIYHPRLIDSQNLPQFWSLLKNQVKIAILAGTGTIASLASTELITFAERFDIPVASTLGAKGIMPEDHPLSLGVFGWFGTRRANELLTSKQIDVLLVLGSKLNQMETFGWSKEILPQHALIINNIDESTWFHNYNPQLFILGDNKTFLQQLLNNEEKNILQSTEEKRKAWLNDYVKKIPHFYDEENLKSDITPIHPTRVIGDLRAVMPRNTILFVGEGAHGFFTTHYWKSFAPGEFFSTVKYMSPMGWSIAAAIGGKLAKPDQPVVCITGDGSMMMHGMEVQTAARYQLPVIFIVFNNKAHGNPQLRGRRIGKFECKFLALPQHNWAKFGEALGAVGMTVTQPEELQSAFKKALELNKTVVIDVITGNFATPTYIFDENMYQIKSPIERF